MTRLLVRIMTLVLTVCLVTDSVAISSVSLNSDGRADRRPPLQSFGIPLFTTQAWAPPSGEFPTASEGVTGKSSRRNAKLTAVASSNRRSVKDGSWVSSRTLSSLLAMRSGGSGRTEAELRARLKQLRDAAEAQFGPRALDLLIRNYAMDPNQIVRPPLNKCISDPSQPIDDITVRGYEIAFETLGPLPKWPEKNATTAIPVSSHLGLDYYDDRDVLEFVFGDGLQTVLHQVHSERDGPSGQKDRALLRRALMIDMVQAYRLLAAGGAWRKGRAILTTDDTVNRAFQWMDLQGYVLRIKGGAWSVEGLAARVPGALRTTHWPDEQKSRWDKLKKVETYSAVAERVKLILAAAGLKTTDLDAATQRRLKDWEKTTGLSLDDRFDQGIEEWADFLGVEPILLRTGISPTETLLSLLPQLPAMAQGERVEALRHVSGKSRRTVAAEMTAELKRNVTLTSIRELETGDTGDFEHSSFWPALARSISCDPFLMLLGLSEVQALTTAMPQGEGRRVIAIQNAAGITDQEFASRAGVSRNIIWRWRSTWKPTLSPENLLLAARGQITQGEARRRRKEELPLRQAHTGAWKALTAIAHSDTLRGLALSGDLTATEICHVTEELISTVTSRLADLRRLGFAERVSIRGRRDSKLRLTLQGQKIVAEIRSGGPAAIAPGSVSGEEDGDVHGMLGLWRPLYAIFEWGGRPELISGKLVPRMEELFYTVIPVALTAALLAALRILETMFFALVPVSLAWEADGVGAMGGQVRLINEETIWNFAGRCTEWLFVHNHKSVLRVRPPDQGGGKGWLAPTETEREILRLLKRTTFALGRTAYETAGGTWLQRLDVGWDEATRPHAERNARTAVMGGIMAMTGDSHTFGGEGDPLAELRRLLRDGTPNAAYLGTRLQVLMKTKLPSDELNQLLLQTLRAASGASEGALATLSVSAGSREDSPVTITIGFKSSVVLPGPGFRRDWRTGSLLGVRIESAKPPASPPGASLRTIAWIGGAFFTLHSLAGNAWSQAQQTASQLHEPVRHLGLYTLTAALLMMMSFLRNFHLRLAPADSRRGEWLMDWMHQLQNKFMARNHKTLFKHSVTKPKELAVKSPVPKRPRSQSFNAPTSYANFSRAFPTVIRQTPRTAAQLSAVAPDPSYTPAAALKNLIHDTLIERHGMKIPELAARARVSKADLQTFLNEEPAREFPGRGRVAEACKVILEGALANLEDSPTSEILPCPFPIPREMVESLHDKFLEMAINELFALARATLLPALVTQSVGGEPLTIRPVELSARVLEHLFDSKKERLRPQYQVFINGVVPSPEGFKLSRQELLKVSLWVDSVLRNPAVYALLNRALDRAPSTSGKTQRAA